jgi:hypothetical protein
MLTFRQRVLRVARGDKANAGLLDSQTTFDSVRLIAHPSNFDHLLRLALARQD